MHTLFALLLLSQAPLPQENELAAIRPGTSVFGWCADVSSSTTTYLLRASTSGKSNYLPIADGTLLTARNNSATAAEIITCCWSNTPTPQIGSGAAAGTTMSIDDSANSPLGDGAGGCWQVAPGERTSERADHPLLIRTPGGGQTNVCAEPSSFNRARETLEIYPGCLYDAHCNNVAGVPSSTLCSTNSLVNQTTIARLLRQSHTRRGLYLGCRAASGSPRLCYWIGR